MNPKHAFGGLFRRDVASEGRSVAPVHGIRLSSDNGRGKYGGSVCLKLMICTLPRLIAAALLLLVAGELRGQDEDKPLTTIDEVLKYDARAAEIKPHAVRLKGAVVGVSSLYSYFYMHDGRHAIAVRYTRKLAPPKQGDQVEIVGETSLQSPDGQQIMRVVALDFTVTGTAELPQAKMVEHEELLTASAMDQWHSCEGRITDWHFNAPDLLLRVVLREGPFDALVTLPGATEAPAQLMGARVRLTGAVTFTPALGRVLFVPDTKQFEVLDHGVDDLFNTPLLSVPQVLERGFDAGEALRVRGVVLGRTPDDVLHLRGGNGALRIRLRQPLNRTDKSRETAAIGDEVEVVGFHVEAPGGSQPTCDLYEGHLRVIGKGVEPKPLIAPLSDIVAGAHTSDFVETLGHLITLQQVPLEHGDWRTTILIESNGVTLPVVLHTHSRASLNTIKPDDDLIIRGLVEPATEVDQCQIHLLGPEGVKSLGLSFMVRKRQLWLWAGSILVVVLIFSGWIAALRKSNRVKTEVAALLEHRVAERTLELSKAQAELTRALDHERELGELKSRFVTMVSHEFRTPLGIIMSAIELMRHYDDRLPKEQLNELQEDIFSATRHMAGLMEQVLVLGRVEAGKLGCKTTPCDLDILAGKLTDESLSATNRRCVVNWQAEGDMSGARADEALLRHIFSNLITNAVKYSPEGSTVEFTARREGEDAVFKVVDHGIGIPETDREHLFEAFHRCSNVGEIPGTGLGLVIVKRCVDLHGGSLRIDSTVGQGTTITVRLPLFAV